jgi:hypothetical protein
MSQEKPDDDPRQRSDSKQTDEPWKGKSRSRAGLSPTRKSGTIPARTNGRATQLAASVQGSWTSLGLHTRQRSQVRDCR